MKSLILMEEAYDLHKLYSPKRLNSNRIIIDRTDALLLEINQTYLEEKDELLLDIKKLLKSLIVQMNQIKV